MKEFIWILVVILGLGLCYPLYLYVRMKISKRKITSVLNKIRNQVDFKHSLLKEYVEINKDVIDEDKYMEIEHQLTYYCANKDNTVGDLKKLNEIYAAYMIEFNDGLLKRKCNESEEYITNMKEQYNSLVKGYNEYKSYKVNAILSKVMFIKDENIF